ncbi:MAG: DUF4326 domain-containing protein [Bradyrhizobiaceae bacterium]|nr:MAG: DUF4326 domain-containing protein [Bradyrhizobiaceae bacterium]
MVTQASAASAAASVGGSVRDRACRSRPQVIAEYRARIVAQPKLMNALDELRGRDLVCWCAPLACHGDVLRELANKI